MVTDSQISAAKKEADEAVALGDVLERAGIRDCFPLMRGDTTVDAKGTISVGRPNLEQAGKLITVLTELLDAKEQAGS